MRPMTPFRLKKMPLQLALCMASLAIGMATVGASGDEKSQEIRGRIGKDSWKIKRGKGKIQVWAGGDKSGPGFQWYDFTGSPIPAEKLQFGIGKDRIRAIDDPVFVSPDNPHLLRTAGKSHYNPELTAKTNDEIKVIGWIEGTEARAYPVVLLERHELVNDTVGGKPITVGW